MSFASAPDDKVACVSSCCQAGNAGVALRGWRILDPGLGPVYLAPSKWAGLAGG
jgi:hypothetical protein